MIETDISKNALSSYNRFDPFCHTASAWMDDLGRLHPRAAFPCRIVSLVPSITELLFDLGLEEYLVGRTGFCIHPAPAVKKIPKIGGTKNVHLDKIRQLKPTHAVVNVDENPKEVAEALAGFVPHLIVTHPLAPLDNLKLYRLLGGIFDREARAAELEKAFSTAHETVLRAAHSLPRQRVLYLIWRKPWMTVSRDTYISRTLALVGWDTVPAEASIRYPELTAFPECLAGADRVLLSSEPYPFREKHLAELRGALPAGSSCRIGLVDGEMVSWYGSRAIRGLSYLLRLRTSE